MTNLIEKKRLPGPRWAWWGGGGVGVIVIAWILFSTSSTPATVSAIGLVQRGSMEVSVVAPGRIRAANSVDIDVPRISGELQLVYLVTEGTYVEAGQIIARLDSAAAVENLETAADELATEEADFAQMLKDQENQILDMQNAVRSAELSYRQGELQLVALEFSSELEKQQGQLNLEKARISRDEAIRKLAAQRIINEAQRFQEEISLEGERRDYQEEIEEFAELTIRTPIAGMVIHAEQGRFFDRVKVREGDNVRRGQEIVQLPDLSELQALVMINELDGQRVRDGQRAHVRLESYPKETFEGTVTDMSTLAQQTEDGGNVRVFQAVITLNEADPRIRPGMTASAEIVVDVLEDVLKMPLSGCGVSDDCCLALRVGDDEPIEVTLGLRNESEAQVIAGLSEGDQIRLGWMEEPGHMIAVLAGTLPLPEETSQAILTQGDHYGTSELPSISGGPGADVHGGSEAGARGAAGEAGNRMGGESGMRMDPSLMPPEMRARMEQMGRQRETGGEQEPGMGRMGMRGATLDSTRIANLQERAAALPEDLRAELERLMSGGTVDMSTLSTALRDSLRAWGVFGSGRGRGGGAGQIPPAIPPDPPTISDRTWMPLGDIDKQEGIVR
jgi:multidrug efflux pump subunit AcrA (membrane-fusion protein)